MRERFSDDRGAGLVEYALIVLAIALASFALVANVGDSTSDSFEQAASSFNGPVAEPEVELTPEEAWQKAQEDYDKAIADATATKTAEIADAKSTYDTARANNASLPKAERQQANAAAKTEFDGAKADANAKYKDTVQSAKDAKSAAKAEYNANK